MAKTNQQKQSEFRQRHSIAGRTELRGLYARPEHRQQIKEFVQGLYESDVAGAFSAPKELTTWLAAKN